MYVYNVHIGREFFTLLVPSPLSLVHEWLYLFLWNSENREQEKCVVRNVIVQQGIERANYSVGLRKLNGKQQQIQYLIWGFQFSSRALNLSVIHQYTIIDLWES